MALDRDDIDGLAKAFKKAMGEVDFRPEKSVPSRRATTASDRTSKSQGKTQEELLAIAKKQLALDKKSLATDADSIKIQEKYNTAMESAVKSLTSFTRGIIKPGSLSKMNKALENVTADSEGLSSKLAQMHKNASQYGSALMEAHQSLEDGTDGFNKYIKKLADGTSKLSKSFLEQQDVIDEATGKIKAGIGAADFAGIRRSVGSMQSMIEEQIKNLGLSGLSALTPEELDRRMASGKNATPYSAANINQTQDVLMTIAQQLQKSGMLDANINLETGKLTPEDYKKLAESIKEADASMTNYSKTVDRAAVQSNKTLSNIFGNAQGKVMGFVRGLSDHAKVMASMAAAANGAKDVYKDMMSFNIAHLAAGFLDVNKYSVMLGMSLEETVAFMQQNKQVLSAVGVEEFQKMTSGFNKTFNEFGYTLKQGAAAIGPTLEAAIAAGVNVRSQQELNAYMEQNAAAHKKIAGVLNVSLPEYAKLNAELLNESEIKGTLAGLDREQSLAYARNIETLRDEMAVRLGSIQQAQELIKLNEKSKREKVSERIKNAANLAMQAQASGMGAQSGELFNLSLKGRTRTEEEDKRFVALTTELGKAREQTMASTTGGGNIAQDLGISLRYEASALSGDIESMVQKGTTIAANERAKAIASAEEQRQRAAAAGGSPLLATLGGYVESFKSLISNNITTTATGAGLALAGMAAQTLMTTIALAKLSGAAGGGSIAGAARDMLGKGKGAIAGRAMGIGGTVLGGAALGLGAYSAWTDVNANEAAVKAGTMTKAQETVANAGSVGMLAGAGSGAALGAGFGSVVPGIGTLIGGAAGGIIGGGLGYFGGKGIGSIISPNQPVAGALANQVNTVEAQQTQSDKTKINILAVTDTAANEKLEIIAKNMIEAVKILKEMSEASGPIKKAQFSMSPIASQSAYLSGNMT